MNYLTNYYKNLSEQLQAKLNNLEAQAQMLNEALTSYTVYNRNGTPTVDTGAASGGAGEEGGVQGDYNGDGLVDGADLALALGNYGSPNFNVNTVLQNWSNQWQSLQMPAPNAPGGSPESAGGVGAGTYNRPTAAGAAGGPGRTMKGARPTAAGAAGGPAVNYGKGTGRSSRPSVGGEAGAQGGGYAKPGRRPSVGGEAGGPGAGYYKPPFSVAGEAGGPGANYPTSAGAAGGAGYAGEALPPLTDLNGDGIVDGADLGIYMGRYNAVPPGFGPNAQGGAQSWNPAYSAEYVPQNQLRRRTVR